MALECVIHRIGTTFFLKNAIHWLTAVHWKLRQKQN